jgi:hypothetical protein
MGRVARLFALLVVLLGLLAMHGLTSTHHAAAAARMMSSASGASSTSAVAKSTPHDDVHHNGEIPSVSQAAGAHNAPGASRDDDCPTTVLCLAILTAAAAAALALARTRPRAARGPVSVQPRTTAPARARAACTRSRHGALHQPDVSRPPGHRERCLTQSARPPDP